MIHLLLICFERYLEILKIIELTGDEPEGTNQDLIERLESLLKKELPEENQNEIKVLTHRFENKHSAKINLTKKMLPVNNFLNRFETVGEERNGTLYKYVIGSFETIDDAREFLEQMKVQGIKDAFEAHRPYGAGTLSAQSSQMMSLLPAMGIAERMGNVLKLNVDSKVLAELAL